MTSNNTNTTTLPKPQGVHLVGSMCGAPTAAAAFDSALSSFPGRLRRLPDGEPAHRGTFIGWQAGTFAHTPALLRAYDAHFNALPQPPISPAEAAAVVAAMPKPLRPGYDDAALESWEVFKGKKERGEVPRDARFLVCLPTPFAVLCLVRPEFQELVEPLYEEALVDGCLRRIMEVVPREELAVQWDVAAEPMALERVFEPHFEPWFGSGDEEMFEGLVDRVARMVGKVGEGVEVGIHVCYGDMGHKHFVEPKDMGLMARVVREIKRRATRDIDWVHMPVPKDRDDEEYFAPLRSLELGKTELYLGLVHAHDKAGTEKRVKTAQTVLGSCGFGVATECGLGRTPVEDLASIAEISCRIAEPVC
ncbi:hypothetical protein DBV05_g445 [Lasiodiplodia theobromae]|uniref:Methionine synthase n=1 Tax=Lasiodiplodia theobromae TaxID=45133 RepID=A0A5N5DRW6_9PEZI|nr:hypothetical protein DBV05_g445 [Lasiodiplodia theobromae]